MARGRWFLTAVCVLGLVLPARSYAQATPSDAAARVKATVQVLESSYNPKTGLFNGTGWWNSANGITALALASRDLHSGNDNHLFQHTFKVAPEHAPGFLNPYYDDEGWWALAWLDVYAVHPKARYLRTSEAIFADMTGGWSDTCGGGIWWKKDVHYKNAIANELFLSVAVRLAALSAGDRHAMYLDWAQREERWFLASGMINADGLVNDGLDADCKNNGKTTWTYNQGVILGGFVGLHALAPDATALATANRIAAAVSAHLTDGVVHDPCEPKGCGADGVQFKGVLMRNLATLYAVNPTAEVKRLIDANAGSVWDKARAADGRFAVNWAGPAQDYGTGALISALDALVAELTIEGPQPAAQP